MEENPWKEGGLVIYYWKNELHTLVGETEAVKGKEGWAAKRKLKLSPG